MMLATLIDTHGVQVLDHLDTQVDVPVLPTLQAQGDILALPADITAAGLIPVPAGGLPVVRGEATGNTHHLVAAPDAGVLAALSSGSTDDLTVCRVLVPAGQQAYLAHPEHGYLGLGAGGWEIRRQRQQTDIVRMVTD